MHHHDYANIFPLIEDDAFKQLVVSIHDHGLEHPIVTFDDQILDGRNRYAACKKAGVAPRYVEYEGDDPLGYVVRSNLHRRHLTKDQRDEVVAKLAGVEDVAP